MAARIEHSVAESYFNDSIEHDAYLWGAVDSK